MKKLTPANLRISVLTANDEQKRILNVRSAKEFYYLNHSSCVEIDGMDDAKEFLNTILALNTLNFSQIDINNLLSIVGAI